ncbi:hypothetical protein EV175_001053 [Coemansia sp. RSA 1933]|nr:hypothetical protein EV175_001053 [Coemansia sp. RSA 1933]
MVVAESNPEAGIHKVDGIDYYETLDGEDRLWYVEAVPGAREISVDLLPDGVAYGVEYTTLTINVPLYLAYMMNLFITNGGSFVQRRISHISEAADVCKEGTGPFIINCTGLGSLSIGGVEDKNMYPIRGQTLLVRAPNVKRTITRKGNVFGYVIPRGDGTVIIGGTAEKNSWDKCPSSDTTETIMHRVLDLEPALVQEEGIASMISKEDKVTDLRARILAVNVGFRPARVGGVRLEHETINTTTHGKLQIFHCYGHGGFGYQSSLAYAKDVLDLVDSVSGTIR